MATKRLLPIPDEPTVEELPRLHRNGDPRTERPASAGTARPDRQLPTGADFAASIEEARTLAGERLSSGNNSGKSLGGKNGFEKNAPQGEEFIDFGKYFDRRKNPDFGIGDNEAAKNAAAGALRYDDPDMGY